MKIFKTQFNFFAKHKKLIYAVILLVVIFGVLTAYLPQISQAQDETVSISGNEVVGSGGGPVSWVAVIIGSILLWIIRLLGSLLLWLMNIVQTIFQYNNFVNARVVEVGWPLVRDLCNMFFVVILLIVAFSTILKVSTYHYKNILLKLVIMAILINFSKTILGFMIDFAQVMMLTFVNGFKDAMAINLSNAFGVSNLVSFHQKAAITLGTFLPAMILSLILVVVAIFTMVVYIVVLLWRIITLWVLMVLSPIAFVGAAFPGLKKYASQFWEKFWSALTLGIALAFFMWLALTLLAMSGQVVQEFDVENLTAKNATPQSNKEQMGLTAGGDVSITEISQADNLFTFVVAIALLLMALQYAQQAGGFAGKFAVAASARLSKIGQGTLKLGGKGIKGALGYGREKVEQWTGLPLNLKEWKEGWEKGKEARRYRRKEKREARATKRGGVLGALGTPTHFFSERWNWGLPKQVIQEGFAGGRIKDKMNKYNNLNNQIGGLKGVKGKLDKGKELNNDEKKFVNSLGIEDVNINIGSIDAKLNTLQKERVGLDEEIRRVKGPVNYDLQKVLRGDYNTQLKDIHTDEWKELVPYFEDAQKKGDFAKAGAILLKATMDANANEFLNQFSYDADGEGLKQFILRELVGSKGMTKKEREDYNKTYGERHGKIEEKEGMGMSMTQALLLGTDVGYAAEKTMQWQSTRLTAANPDGNLRFMTPEERQLEIGYETGKITEEKILGASNRLFGYLERIVGDLTNYKITGNRDSLILPAMLDRFINKGPQMLYVAGRGRLTESHVENLAKDQNYVLWRKFADEKLKGNQKEEFIVLLNILREQGLQSLGAKNYKNEDEKLQNWRREQMDGEDGHIARVLKTAGIDFDPAEDTYDKLCEKYKNSMLKFNGTGKVDAKIKGTDMIIGGEKLEGPKDYIKGIPDDYIKAEHKRKEELAPAGQEATPGAEEGKEKEGEGKGEQDKHLKELENLRQSLDELNKNLMKVDTTISELQAALETMEKGIEKKDSKLVLDGALRLVMQSSDIANFIGSQKAGWFDDVNNRRQFLKLIDQQFSKVVGGSLAEKIKNYFKFLKEEEQTKKVKESLDKYYPENK